MIERTYWFRYHIRHELPEKIIMKIVWALPHRIVYWAAIRLWADATAGKYGNTHPDSLTLGTALGRWEARDGGDKHHDPHRAIEPQP